MSQETNLNVAPYFDDFDANNDYYKVLFKPGYPVQARELTTLQSILQNQVERFGQHFFKEGAKVIPGNTAYSTQYFAVLLENNYLGIPISKYIDQIIGAKITGQTSGVTAVVKEVLLSNESERGQTTLYVSYLGSNAADNTGLTFSPGELLSSNVTISSENTIIAAGEAFSLTVPVNATATGSAFSIQNGIYFAKGTFLNVDSETLILDQYSNIPTYRIGLLITEEIITSDLDPSLNDNSRGFNNYSAPGADRLKMTCALHKKAIDDFEDNNFIELASVDRGILRSRKSTTEYNLVADELARRTFAESGDYYIKPFGLAVKESLNDNNGNGGVFNANQSTYGGQQPTDDLALYKISPGKAFVRGYEIETISPTFVDVPKPRTTRLLEDQQINYEVGSTFNLNRVYGAPTVGVGGTYILSLRDQRVGDDAKVIPGKEIGVARVYDFKLDSGSYNSGNANINEWDLSLYDIQTVTEITLNEPITLTVPTHIKGKYSGTTAFLKEPVAAGTALTVYETSGKFLKNENFIIDGVENTRVALAATAYGPGDVKSVFGSSNGAEAGAAKTFSADVDQYGAVNIGVGTISAATDGYESEIRSASPVFPTQVKLGNLISYTGTTIDPVFVRVVSVGSSHVTVTGVSTVTGICDGTLPQATTQVSDLKVLDSRLSDSDDNAFYTAFPKANIESVDLTDASLTIRKSFTGLAIDNNQVTTTVTTGDNESFLPFTPERYALIRSDGTTEPLTDDKMTFGSGSTTLTITGLGAKDVDVTLIASITKVKPKAKTKLKTRVGSVTINNSTNAGSGTGSTTLNDGLTYGNYPFGTRVQDEELSLNVPDIIMIHGVFESTDTDAPNAPKATFSALSGPTGKTTDLIIGEKFTGQTSGATGIYLERVDDTNIYFTLTNQTNLIEGEAVIFAESEVQATLTATTVTSLDVSNQYKFTTGQNASFYDIGTLKRKPDVSAPVRSLKAYYMAGNYESTDDGDITTIESYKAWDYSKEIQTVDGNRNTDLIDIRPRVEAYTVALDSRSPLEFYGRTFGSTLNSAANVLASNEGILTDFTYYQGRIDRIFLTKSGVFQIKYGVPSDNPEAPGTVDGAMEIATVQLPPYLYNVSNCSKQFMEHKRYRMSDIKKLENRIKNLEYYTTLSLLESNTANLFIPDSTGINRFKSGFFVDNFTSLNVQERGVTYKNSIDINKKELRPQHYTTSIDLIQGPVEGVNPQRDLSVTQPEGNNITKQPNGVVTLAYDEVEYYNQPFATRTESVTPFLVSFWNGTVTMAPASDTWTDTVRIEANITQVEGDFTQVLEEAVRTQGVDPQTGLAPTIWNAWETTWTGQEVTTITRDRTTTTTSGGRWGRRGFGGNGGLTGGNWIEDVNTTTIRDTLQEVIDTGIDTRTGTRTVVTEQFDMESVGDRIVSRDLITFMRSRNVTFTGQKMKPNTRIYAFFDGVDVSKYCVPKLIEVGMVSGSFQVGETVIGEMDRNSVVLDDDALNANIRFRVATSNHKDGPYNAPTKTYKSSPYGASDQIPAKYSSTSTTLNVDLFSLANQPEGNFSGYVAKGMKLVGQTSGAQAEVTEVRLISDLGAYVAGSFFIPDPNKGGNPKFETGTKVLTLSNSATNNDNEASTLASSTFTSSGTLETVQEEIISVRNASVQQRAEFDERAAARGTGDFRVISSEVVGTNSEQRSRVIWYDPLAQSFLVEEETGVFLTKCDVFFSAKDDNDIPFTFQLRTMNGGFPTQHVIPFSEVIVEPDDVNVSSDGSVPTTVNFKAPVYLEGGKEYAICLASISTKYEVYISRVGENDLITDKFISNQPTLGSLFKSQNASTWEPSQWEDLKFKLHRANFVQGGTIEFYNPELTKGNKQIASLIPNPVSVASRTVRLGISSDVVDTDLTFGNVITQHGTNATGNYVANAGIATGALNVNAAGIGYTPAAASLTFNDVELSTITGKGRNATANVTVANGVVTGATIVTGGDGYVVGDVLGITTIGNDKLGAGARLSVSTLHQTTELVLNNVQGDFSTVGSGKTITFTNNAGLSTDLNAATHGGVQLNTINVDNDGLHVKVNHKNHGMYFDGNFVTVGGVRPNLTPTKLSAAYDSSATTALSVDSTEGLDTFENVGVGTTNAGYLLIGNEVLSYTSASGTEVSGTIVRGIDSTVSRNYPAGTPVYKYELGGVSLRRINKTHNLENVTVANPITFDSYNIKLDMGSSGVGRSTGESFPILYMGSDGNFGGSNVTATQNIPFEVITPVVQSVAVKGTSISATVRTTTAASIDGNEIPFTNAGSESVSLFRSNYLTSPRLIGSKVNEDAFTDTEAGNKSFQMSLSLNTENSFVSPVVDTERVSAILTSQRVNNAVTNFIEDNRVNGIDTDPTAFQYLTKEIVLENSATSIKVMVDAYKNRYSEIRAFYAVGDSENFTPIYQLFPGYDNLDERGQVIDASRDSGLSDSYIAPATTLGSNGEELQFKEHSFTIDNLPSFRAYRIKLVMTSTNQVFVPRMRNLRVIALA